MITPVHARTMAAYNRWMNERLYELCAGIPDAERKRDRGAFFKSVHGTLNHLLVADRIWMRRFTGEGPVHDRLDVILHDDLAGLRAAREAEDARIEAYVGGLDEAALAGRLRYRTIVRPMEVEQPLAPALLHFFNHQTHHRGQATTLLSQAGVDVGVTDLLMLIPEAAL